MGHQDARRSSAARRTAARRLEPHSGNWAANVAVSGAVAAQNGNRGVRRALQNRLHASSESAIVRAVTEQFVLRIDGIEGDSMLDGHTDSIDVVSWSWGVARRNAPGAGTGAGSGRPDFDELHVAASISRASPALVESCVTGRHHRKAVLTGLRASGDGQFVDFLEYELGDVSITSVEHGDTDDGPPIEEVSIDYRTFEIRYVPQRADGSSGQAIGFEHDLNRPK